MLLRRLPEQHNTGFATIVGSATFIGRSTYFVDLGPIFSIYFCARDTCEAGQKLFSIGVNRIDRGFRHDPAVARSDVKAKKSFIVARSGASTPWWRQ